MEWSEALPPWAMFAMVTLAGVLLIVALALAFRRRVGDSFPYHRQAVVLSPEERALHQGLQQAVADRALLLSKVGVADVLSVRRNLSRRRAAAALQRIAGLSFDFVVCEPQDTRPLVAVELERQETGQRRRRDRFLDEACHAAGLGLLRVPPSEQYAAEDLREQLRPYIDRSERFSGGEVTPDGRREPILDLPAE